MSRKSENEKHFIEKSAELVAAIDGYNGLDPLDPWYKYMTWLQETYEIDYSPDSLFMSILCQCIATFEADERYKQDRRMIKLFILYVCIATDYKVNIGGHVVISIRSNFR